MLHKTKGIVLSYVPYRETSIIVKIYTERFGIQTYVENSVRKAKGKNKMALFQPLTLLELVVYHNERKDIQRISEIKCPNPLTSVPFEIKKTSLGIFINEVLNKSLKEEEANEELFFFLYQAILTLDALQVEVENFHLKFLAKFSTFLGFAPQNTKEIIDQLYEAGLSIPKEERVEKALDHILLSTWESQVLMTNLERSQVLDLLVNFYRLHIEHFNNLKSTPILKEVLS